jgi:hypothetical protein
MVESEIAERIAVRRAELDKLEDQLVKQLAEVRAERDELAVAERVWQRMADLLAAETAAAELATAQVAGRAVLLVPHREPGVGEDALCRRSTSASSRSCARPGRRWRPSRSARCWGFR